MIRVRPHGDAWRIPKSDRTDYGVLVRCGPSEHPYWWLLCPATATLYLNDSVPSDLRDCQYDAECDHDDVHRAAVILRESIEREEAAS